MLAHTDTDISVPGIGIGMNTRYRSNPRPKTNVLRASVRAFAWALRALRALGLRALGLRALGLRALGPRGGLCLRAQKLTQKPAKQ